MIKYDVTYKDFNDEDQTDTLRFHLSMAELTGNQELVEEFISLDDKWNAMQKDEGEVTPEGRQFLVNIVKRMMKLSYGEVSEDGKKFKKSDELYAEFEQSAAYEKFFFELFYPDPFRCLEFLMSLFPEEHMGEAMAQIEVLKEASQKNEADLPPDPSIPEGAIAPPVVETVPKKPQDMTREELLAAMRARNQA